VRSTSTDGLWAITCYYNPVPHRQRLTNFRIFRENLEVPLVAVEAVYDKPDLTTADAEILVQRQCEDVLWQKERLLNLALEALPPECERVAILDGDVVFTNADWIERVHAALDEVPLCQAFRSAHHLPRGYTGSKPTVSAGVKGHSLAALLAEGTLIEDLFGRGLTLWEQGCAPGLAWAAHRSLLEKHGFYEGGVVGGADVAMAFASQGKFAPAYEVFRMNSRMSAHYRAWAEPFYADIRGRVSFADNTLLHLWHGDMARRFYIERHLGLVPFEFDPATDLEVTDSGCLGWATDKSEMHDFVRSYFSSRTRDG
jgi:hypothetical protein